MYIDIVSPETTLFSGEIQSITVPGTKGSFQILNQHAPIVSTLTKGKVKIQGELSEFFTNIKDEAKLRGNDIDNCEIEWLEGTSEISKTNIKAKISSMEYISKRQVEYPSIGEQLDMIYRAGQGGDEFQKAIKAIKDKYPKG